MTLHFIHTPSSGPPGQDPGLLGSLGSQAQPSHGNLQAECLREAEESRDHGWVSHGGDQREEWAGKPIDEMAKQPEVPHVISVCLWRPGWLSSVKQKFLPNSVQLRLASERMCLLEPTQTAWGRALETAG